MQRNDGTGWKVRVLQLLAGLIQHLAECQRHQVQVRRQRLEVGRRQGAQKVILAGVRRGRHVRLRCAHRPEWWSARRRCRGTLESGRPG